MEKELVRGDLSRRGFLDRSMAALTVGARKKGGRPAPRTSRSPSRKSAGSSSGFSGPPPAVPSRRSSGPVGGATTRGSLRNATGVAA